MGTSIQGVARFRFFHAGNEIVGAVQGSGGPVYVPERMGLAKRRASRGRPHGLYEPAPGCVLVYPHWSDVDSGLSMIVPIAAFAGEVSQ